jgi:hypothetical protein
MENAMPSSARNTISVPILSVLQSLIASEQVMQKIYVATDEQLLNLQAALKRVFESKRIESLLNGTLDWRSLGQYINVETDCLSLTLYCSANEFSLVALRF